MANGEPISFGRMSGFSAESSLATSRASGLPGPTISPSIAAMSAPRPKKWLETEPPAVNFEWSEHMHEIVILCSWLSFVSTPITRGSIRPALMSATPTESSTMFLLFSSASASALASPPVPVPSPPNCDGSIGFDAVAGAVSTAGATGAEPAGASPSTRMKTTFAPPPTCAGPRLTWSALLPSSAVNLPSLTVLSRNPMWPSAPKSFWPPQS